MFVLLANVLMACGGGGASTNSTSTGSNGGSETTGKAAIQGSRGFLTPGGDNSVQNFGSEAAGAELSDASAVLTAYMRARAKDEWTAECTYLAHAATAPLEQLAASSPRLKGGGCGAILKALEGGTPISTRADTMHGDVASLRVKGDRGFALYHGTHGVDYFIPMVKEAGRWKVGSLAPDEFP